MGKKIQSLMHDMANKLAIQEYQIRKLKGFSEKCDGCTTAEQETLESLTQVTKLIIDIFQETKKEVVRVGATTLEPTHLSERKILLEQELPRIQAVYQLEHLSVKFNVAEDCAVYADKDLTMRIIQNLIENAVRHGNANTVKIEYVEHEKEVTAHFKDNGRGISSDIVDNLNRGLQLKDDPNHGRGAMLLKELINETGGWIEYRSIEGLGTEVIVHLRKC
ncbi:HAMP domain-containing histidine kinase, partial [Candidatus Babeliales bacterium]|nr:HAMP domain-containing histidine kinase [Candidatus Babeliales bacterium]